MMRVSTAVAVAVASLVAFSSPAVAQSYGGITLSFGTAPYGGYGYDEDDYDRGGYYRYAEPAYRQDYVDRYEAWRAHERRERWERWRVEQERRRQWQRERWEHQRWGDDDD